MVVVVVACRHVVLLVVHSQRGAFWVLSDRSSRGSRGRSRRQWLVLLSSRKVVPRCAPCGLEVVEVRL